MNEGLIGTCKSHLDPGPGYEPPVRGLAIAALLVFAPGSLSLVPMVIMVTLTIGWRKVPLLINNNNSVCGGVSISQLKM